MGNSVYLISIKDHKGCALLAKYTYSSMAPDPTFAFVGFSLPYTLYVYFR
jgi:hypothetical protein